MNNKSEPTMDKDKVMGKTYSYNCPHCGSRFTNEDVDRAKTELTKRKEEV
jgi:uncharacterized radical SAM superfamily protein